MATTKICHGKHREFRNFATTKNCVYPSCEFLDLKNEGYSDFYGYPLKCYIFSQILDGSVM